MRMGKGGRDVGVGREGGQGEREAYPGSVSRRKTDRPAAGSRDRDKEEGRVQFERNPRV